jgi:phage baseplate assembly protein gpV
VTIIPILRSIIARLGEHERRLAGTSMRGKVKQIDTTKAMVRIAIGKDDDDDDVLSPWVPYKQTAGAMKLHNPPSVGQTMDIRSESGDVELGIAEAFHWSDENPAISTAADAHKMTFGSVTIDLSNDGLKLTCGGATFEWTGSGFEQTGGSIKHDGTVIDKSHTHTEVVKGGDLTGPPP